MRKEYSPFAQGLLTNVTITKVFLFFVAFFPQFLGHASNVSLQLLLLSAVFIGLAIVWEAIIVLAAAKLGATMKSKNFTKIMVTICAVAFTGLAVLIVMLRPELDADLASGFSPLVLRNTPCR